MICYLSVKQLLSRWDTRRLIRIQAICIRHFDRALRAKGTFFSILASKIAEQLQLGKAGNAYTEFIEIESLVDTLTSLVNSDDTLVVVSGVRGANVKQTGSDARSASPFGRYSTGFK